LVTIDKAIKLDNVNFAVSGTGGIIGADFTSLSVSFFSSDWTTGAAAATDAVSGAWVNGEVSPESTVLSKKVPVAPVLLF
jgi:hypothetical protein